MGHSAAVFRKLNQDVLRVLNGKPANKLIWYLDSLEGITDLPKELDEVWATTYSIGAPISKSLKWSVEKHQKFRVEIKKKGNRIEMTQHTAIYIALKKKIIS